MTICSFPHVRDAYERPDYQRIHKASYGTFKNRLAIAERLFLDNHRNCRALDNCFEMGDGDQIAAALVAKAMKDDDLKRAIAKDYPENCLEDGFPERWLADYRKLHNPLGLAA